MLRHVTPISPPSPSTYSGSDPRKWLSALEYNFQTTHTPSPVDTSEISYRVADFLKQYAPFQVAELSDLLAMAAHGRVRFFERNEYILWQGEPHRAQIFVIQQGTVSLWDEANGRSQLRDIRGAGDMLGLERYTGARSCPHTARSESDVVLYAFPADDFEACVLKYPHGGSVRRGRRAVDAGLRSPAASRRDPQDTSLHDVVSRRPLVTCRMEDGLNEVAARLLGSSSDALAVVDDEGRPVGVLTVASILRWAAAGGGDAARDDRGARGAGCDAADGGAGYLTRRRSAGDGHRPASRRLP